MAIIFNSKNKTFYLETKNSSYIFKIGHLNIVEHLYYGSKIAREDLSSITNRQIYTIPPYSDGDRSYAKGVVMQETSVFNSGDLRECQIVINGHLDTEFTYKSHKILKNRKEIPGLPYSRNNNCEALEVKLLNATKDLELTLYYVVYKNFDVIARYTSIKNNSKNSIQLSRFLSMNLDFNNKDYDFLSTSGIYSYEKAGIDHFPLHKGIQGRCSSGGASSHHTDPFFALVGKDADEVSGEVYGFNLLYSGSFRSQVEVDQFENSRALLGINYDGFLFEVKPNEEFYSPEAIMTFSNEGLSKMSQNFHDHIRNNIIDKKFAFKSHPLVVNSWEGHYFDVDEKIIEELANSAKKIGADTVVIDDGWFRPNAEGGLGDWKLRKDKFPSGLKALSEKIHQKGLKFGIWIEPEMVSKDTELYKNNKNVILSANKNPYCGRHQYVLDLTNDVNINKVAKNILNALKDVKLDYIKLDYNRYPHDANSLRVPSGEVYHRQVLGTYKLIKILQEAMPNVFLESCAGGGGRFDLGMLFYSPMIWTSDNTDPYNRIYIQYGNSLAYPQSAISCHFTEGVCITKRPSTFDFRYLVASFGSYGYELDLSKHTIDELKKLKEFSKRFKKDEAFMLKSDLYRLISPATNQFVAYINVNKTKTKAIFNFLCFALTGFYESFPIRLAGLDPKKKYKNSYNNEVHSGKVYMNSGIRLNNLFKTHDGDGIRIYFEEVK